MLQEKLPSKIFFFLLSLQLLCQQVNANQSGCDFEQIAAVLQSQQQNFQQVFLATHENLLRQAQASSSENVAAILSPIDALQRLLYPVCLLGNRSTPDTLGVTTSLGTHHLPHQERAIFMDSAAYEEQRENEELPTGGHATKNSGHRWTPHQGQVTSRTTSMRGTAFVFNSG